MKLPNRRIQKISLIVAASLIVLVVVVIACVSPIAKYLVEKYDIVYTGREIKVRRSYVNPFTGYISFGDVKIYEQKSDSVFISAESLSGNFAILKLLSGTYEFTELILNKPRGIIIQDHEHFNFTDLIEFFTPKEVKKEKKEPLHLSLLNMKVNKGEFFYHEKVIPVKYSIKNVDLESSGLKWDSDTMDLKFSFTSGNDSGSIRGEMMINKINSDYKLSARADNYDLRFIGQYLRDLTHYGSFKATLDADVKARGNFKENQDVNAKGLIAVKDFHVGKEEGDDYASFKKFTLKIETLSPKNKKYEFDSVSIIRPFFKYEQYDYLNNLERMFGEKGAEAKNPSEFNLIIKIGEYIVDLAKNFFKSDYKINRLGIYDGKFVYNDFSLSEKFSVCADPVSLIADSIKRKDKPVEFVFRTGIIPYGNAAVNISINPRDSSDFDATYHFDQLPAAMFNPYLITLSTFPLDRGTIELKGKWRVRNGIIKSDNRIVILDPRLSNRVKKKDTKWIPLKLVMFFVRERGNVIDYEVPINGNLKDPRFNFKDVILDILENIFLKPPTAPYITHVRKVENEIEKSLILKWQMRQTYFMPGQDDLLEELVKFLRENPSVSIDVKPVMYAEKEKEYIMLFEAKKKFYMDTQHKAEKELNAEDSIMIERMSIKDSVFINFLDARIGKNLLFTVQEKCIAFLGPKAIQDKYRQLIKKRNEAFIAYLSENGVAEHVKIDRSQDKIPYNGFSFYRIDYNGSLPEDLVKAFQRINELNEIPPREKYKEKRETRRGLIRARNRS